MSRCWFATIRPPCCHFDIYSDPHINECLMMFDDDDGDDDDDIDGDDEK